MTNCVQAIVVLTALIASGIQLVAPGVSDHLPASPPSKGAVRALEGGVTRAAAFVGPPAGSGWARASGPKPANTTAASVLDTLELANRSLVPGNVVPLNGSYPAGVVVDPHDGKLFAGTEGGLLVVINLSSNRIVDTVSLGGEVYDVAYDAANGQVYASHGTWDDSVSVINATSDQITGTIRVSPGPAGITLDPARARAYVIGTNVSIVSTVTDTVTGWINAGAYPSYAALDGSNGYLFVTNTNSNSVSIIDTATDSVVSTPQVGSTPGNIVYDPANGDIYVVDDNPNSANAAGSVTVLNGSSGALVTTIQVGVCPWGAAYDSSTNDVFVTDTTCTSAGSLSVIDSTTNTVSATVALGWDTYPYAIAYDGVNGLLYTANYFATNLSIINGSTQRVIGTIGSGALPTDLTYDPTNGLMYAANSGGNEIAILRGSTGAEVGSIRSLYGPDGLAYDSGNGNLYVANSFSDNVSVINTDSNQTVASIPVGSYPQGVEYDPANGEIYVANCNSDNVSAISGATNTVLKSIAAGICPNQITFDSSNKDLYVTNVGPKVEVFGAPGNVTVIDGSSNHAIASLNTGTGPWGSAFDPINGLVYVACFITGNLTVINGTTQTTVGSIHVGLYPTEPAYDPVDGELFIGTARPGNLSYSNEVVAVSAANSSLLGGVSVGTRPLDVALDPSTDHLIVTNLYSGTVSILRPTIYPPPRFLVGFEESGLASGVHWSVTLNGSEASSTARALSFWETIGAYNYAITPVPGYLLISALNGSVKVDGRNVTVSLQFLALFGMYFSETGLPAASLWTVVWNGSAYSAVGPSLSLNATNGSYAFSVLAANGYVPNPANGTIVVNGATVTKIVNFVGPRPNVLSFSVTPDSGPLGTTFALSSTISGGVGALTYLYFGLPGGCTDKNVSQLSCKPWAAGNTTVELIVTDSLGRSSSANATILVTKLQATHPSGTTGGPKFLGMPWEEGLAVLAVLLAILAAGTSLVLLRWRARARRTPEQPPSIRKDNFDR